MSQFTAIDTGGNVYPINIYQETVNGGLSFAESPNGAIYADRIDGVFRAAHNTNTNQLFAQLLVAKISQREGIAAGGKVYWEDLTAVSSVAQSLVPGSALFVGESLLYSDSTLVWAGATNSTASDTVGVTTTTQTFYARLVQEVLSAKGNLTLVLSYILTDLIKASGVVDTRHIANRVKEEYIKLDAAITATFTREVHEIIQMQLSVNDAVRKLLVLRDSFVAHGITQSTYHATVLLQNALKLLHNWDSGKGVNVSEQVAITAVYTTIFGFAGAASDGVVLQATTTPALVFSVEVLDTAVIIDPAGGEGGFDPLQFLGLIIKDKLSVKIGWSANDQTWTGWVLNTQVGAVTNYGSWSFNSFGSIKKVDLAASSSGLFVLGGTNDGGLPINAVVALGNSDFGDSRLKRIQYAYLGVSSSGQLYFITTTDDGVERVYSLVTSNGSVKTERVTMARGVTSRYWSFELRNVDGADFRVDEIEVIPVMLSRRI